MHTVHRFLPFVRCGRSQGDCLREKETVKLGEKEEWSAVHTCARRRTRKKVVATGNRCKGGYSQKAQEIEQASRACFFAEKEKRPIWRELLQRKSDAIRGCFDVCCLGGI